MCHRACVQTTESWYNYSAPAPCHRPGAWPTGRKVPMSKNIIRYCRHCGSAFSNQRGEHGGICSIECRFWSKVDKKVESMTGDIGPCWTWTGCRSSRGYGLFSFRGKTELAPRVSFFLADGRWPECALHKCDNPSCVRRDHLFEGDRVDNNIDRDLKGRGRHNRGERNHSSKLTEADVVAIRSARSGGEPIVSIAARFGVSHPLVSQIAHRKAWRHIA